jgi:type IV pilus assembly protein PilA
MLEKLRKRLAREEKGFTLIELLVVVIILGILTAIAVPSYLSFRGRSQDAANKANVRSIIPTVESYFADNDGTATDPDASTSTTGYAGMTLTLLQSNYDQALETGKYLLSGAASTTYCIQAPAVDDGHAYFKNGPGAPIARVTTSAHC